MYPPGAVSIRLVRLGVITGRVTNAEGKPVRGGRVVAMVQLAGNLPLQPSRMMATVDDRTVREHPGTLLCAEEPKWEYRTVIGPRDADLNALGAEGWELVSAIPQPGDRAAYYFKRRK